MPRVLVHDRAAREDLIEIWLYTLENWSETQADRYSSLLERGIREIAADPESGVVRDELRTGVRSRRIAHHVVFYTFTEDEVRIRRVLHEAMDFGVHL